MRVRSTRRQVEYALNLMTSPKLHRVLNNRKGLRSLTKTEYQAILSTHGEDALIHSARTRENYRSALMLFAEYGRTIQKELSELTKEDIRFYFSRRSEDVGQSMLDQERQTIQRYMQLVGEQLSGTEQLPIYQTEKVEGLSTRAYLTAQIGKIIEHQSHKNALATQIAYTSGLRASEFYTLRPIAERAPDHRPASTKKWLGGMESWGRYTVKGKGGLIREVRIRPDLARELELLKYKYVKVMSDRKVTYFQNYGVGAGNALSSSFSRASKKAFSWSNGFHGLRHTYVQERMHHLVVENHIDYDESLEIVSQELGHFRPSITLAYLR